MKKEISSRCIAGIMVGFLLFGLGFSYFSGEKQDESFRNEQELYKLALEYFNNGQYDLALPLLKQVEVNQKESFPVRYYRGLALANTGNWTEAVNEFQTALDVNPYRVEDSLFMLQFANVLSNAKKFDEEKVVLERCKTLPNPKQIPDYQEKVNEMLAKISSIASNS